MRCRQRVIDERLNGRVMEELLAAEVLKVRR